MGFISSGSTSYSVTGYLTQRGRELILSNKSDFKFIYFALGDSDTNYNIKMDLERGYVPDIAGVTDDCIKSLAQNINIKNKIIK